MKDQSTVENKSMAPAQTKVEEITEPDTNVPTEAPDRSLPQEDDK